MIADCTPVGFICVAPPYAAVAEADYALRIGRPPPGPRIDADEAERLGVSIKEFSSDLVIMTQVTKQNRRCSRRACVVIGRADVSPTSADVGWGASTFDETQAQVYRSVNITATTAAARDAAIAAASLQAGKSGPYIPFAAMPKQLGQ